MSQSAPAEAPARTAGTLDAVTVTVTVHPDQTVEVDQPYLRVPEGADAFDISWTLNNLMPGANVVFDHPAISFFGTPHQEEIVIDDHKRTMRFSNTDPAYQKRSFYYRVHLVWKVSESFLIPLTSDPVIHNDPPP